MELCQQKILEHELDMKLVEVEYSFEGNKILFFFTSEGRVDFRALVKDLAAAFHTRIELRQIGVRDEAKMLGGLGICGREFCCSSFLDEFVPVSIKMAKTQSLSLNPVKISGTCGRLMCCLKYEQHAYEDLLKNAPRADSFVETPDGVGDIISVNTLREKVRVRLDNAPEALKIYHNDEIRIVRSGKGRRPEDYVPPSAQELAKLRRAGTEEEEVSPLAALSRLSPGGFSMPSLSDTWEQEPSEQTEHTPRSRRKGPSQRRGSGPRPEADRGKASPEGKRQETGSPRQGEQKGFKGRKGTGQNKPATSPAQKEKMTPQSAKPIEEGQEKKGEKKPRSGYWRKRRKGGGGGHNPGGQPS